MVTFVIKNLWKTLHGTSTGWKAVGIFWDLQNDFFDYFQINLDDALAL